jgi:glyoxylase-like metal-dependent hydrolase (beta-lactamase superfamily II)
MELEDAGIALVRAENPGPLSLSGTNTWIVGTGPAWVIDPGPALAAHVAAVADEVERRGGLGGIALTHRHADHDEAVPALLARFPAAVAAGGGEVDVALADGDAFGPLRVLATPGHAPEHLAFGLETQRVAFSGDAVLGEGSVFVAPGPGSLAGYLDGLRRLRAWGPRLICPGHGPLVTDPVAKLDEYLAHRAAREDALVAALAGGRRTTDELLDAVWSDVPAALRPAAAVTLAAHLDKLGEEGRLPGGVERPSWA